MADFTSQMEDAMERFAREQAPERAARTDTLVWGKNAVTALLKRGGASGRLDVCNAVVWVLGFVLYRVHMTVDIPVGNAQPDMAGTKLLCLHAHKLVPDKAKAA